MKELGLGEFSDQEGNEEESDHEIKTTQKKGKEGGKKSQL